MSSPGKTKFVATGARSGGSSPTVPPTAKAEAPRPAASAPSIALHSSGEKSPDLSKNAASPTASREEMFGMKATPGAPLFSQGSRRETPKGGAFGINRLKAQAANEKKKSNSNSTNSYYISETPTAPDEKELTLCAAKAIALLIEAGKNKSSQTPPAARLPGQKEPREMIFDERAHCLKSTLKKGVPTEEDIFKYLRIIYKKTRMQPECIVMTVSYIEKVLANPNVIMNVHTWRRITLAALIVADKVFEDYAVWNADFLSLFPQSNIQDLNTLEREFLNMMGFMTAFKASDYAKFYFALKELSDNKDSLPSKPLSQEQAERLENGSKNLSQKSKREEILSESAYSDVHNVAGMDLAVSSDKSKRESRATKQPNEV